MMSVQSFSSYDAKAIRLLSGVLFKVRRIVEDSAPAPFSENERANVTRAVADRLMRIFDLGERNHDVLVRAALAGLPMPDGGGANRDGSTPRDLAPLDGVARRLAAPATSNIVEAPHSEAL